MGSMAAWFYIKWNQKRLNLLRSDCLTVVLMGINVLSTARIWRQIVKSRFKKRNNILCNVCQKTRIQVKQKMRSFRPTIYLQKINSIWKSCFDKQEKNPPKMWNWTGNVLQLTIDHELCANIFANYSLEITLLVLNYHFMYVMLCYFFIK